MGINISCNGIEADTLGSLAKNLPKPLARSVYQKIGKTFIDVPCAYLSVLFGG